MPRNLRNRKIKMAVDLRNLKIHTPQDDQQHWYTTMKVYEALRHCIAELKRVGGDRHLIREAEMAIEMARLKAVAACRCRRSRPGKKPMDLPFADIHAERKRRTPWKEIRRRLDAVGFHMTTRKLMARYAAWKKGSQPVPPSSQPAPGSDAQTT